MYTTYVNGFEKATQRVDKLSGNRRVKAFLEEIKMRPECMKLDLEAFLITPIQRPPRYELLLRDLLKHIPDSKHEESADVEALFNTILDLNKYINSSKREQERRDRLYKLQICTKPRGIHIFSRTDRRVVKEDTLPVHELDPTLDAETRMSLKLGQLKFRMRYFFLFDDMLLEVRQLQTGNFKFIHNYDMNNLIVAVRLPDSASYIRRPPKDAMPQTSKLLEDAANLIAGANAEKAEPKDKTQTTPIPQSGAEDLMKAYRTMDVSEDHTLTFVLAEYMPMVSKEEGGPPEPMLRERVIKCPSLADKTAWTTAIRESVRKATRKSEELQAPLLSQGQPAQKPLDSTEKERLAKERKKKRNLIKGRLFGTKKK